MKKNVVPQDDPLRALPVADLNMLRIALDVAIADTRRLRTPIRDQLRVMRMRVSEAWIAAAATEDMKAE